MECAALTPGHDPGHAWTWADLIGDLVQIHGTLVAVAERLAQRRNHQEDVESVARGLRRLRTRGTKDGGLWGQRVLREFGLPTAVEDRVRWMGQYHTRFIDLPASVCAELLRPWDRPPVSESPARIWVLLGHANLVIRRREDPSDLLNQATLVAPRAEAAAQIELALVQAYAWGRSRPAVAAEALEHAAALLADPTQHLQPDDRANLFSRLVDQQAYPLNKPGNGPALHAEAAALYRSIPADGPLFARSRRANGLGWSLLKLGQRADAHAEALRSVACAGDAGSLRMRAMALNLLAATVEAAEAADIRARAMGIARRLEDEALAARFVRR
jgi:hypothetical protein